MYSVGSAKNAKMSVSEKLTNGQRATDRRESTKEGESRNIQRNRVVGGCVMCEVCGGRCEV